MQISVEGAEDFHRLVQLVELLHQLQQQLVGAAVGQLALVDNINFMIGNHDAVTSTPDDLNLGGYNTMRV